MSNAGFAGDVKSLHCNEGSSPTWRCNNSLNVYTEPISHLYTGKWSYNMDTRCVLLALHMCTLCKAV